MPALNLEPLRATFTGDLVTPEHGSYDDARRLWNASVDKRPAVIARCSGLADIVAAVDFAREKDLLTAVRGGGHDVGGRALCDAASSSICRTCAASMSIRRNAPSASKVVPTLGDLDGETYAFGLAVPCGVLPKTGIGGLTLGGVVADSQVRDVD